MKNLALSIAVASVALLPFTSVCIGAEANDALTKQVQDVLAECDKIKLGMTRADLLKIFATEGGLSTAAHRTFVYRSCPYIKVDAEFKIADPKKVLEEHDTDTISKISKPYLDYMVLD